MPSGSELEALKIVAEKEETTPFAVAREMKCDIPYARLLCNALGRADYIDVLTSGKVRITAKGKASLRK